MNTDAIGFALYYLVVLGGIGAIVGVAFGALAALTLNNRLRHLGGDALLGAVALYGGYQLRVFLRLHYGVRTSGYDSGPWLECTVAALLAIIRQVFRFYRRRSAR